MLNAQGIDVIGKVLSCFFLEQMADIARVRLTAIKLYHSPKLPRQELNFI